jgi:hypothetical protein
MTNPYGTARSGGIELDLREELSQLLYGSAGEIAKGKVGLLRKMREGSDGELLRCPCRSRITDEPDRDSFCRYCHGHGYFWDEYKIVYYKNNESFQDGGKGLFYLEYNVDVSSSDFIVEVVLDNEGRPAQPVERSAVYEIVSADQFRADRGRVEFWQVTAQYRREWSVWYGVKNRQYNSYSRSRRGC